MLKLNEVMVFGIHRVEIRVISETHCRVNVNRDTCTMQLKPLKNKGLVRMLDDQRRRYYNIHPANYGKYERMLTAILTIQGLPDGV